MIDGKKGTLIHSPDTVIHGIFLQDKSQTTVKKRDWKGSSKTNVYASQNDKPLKAELNKSGADLVFGGKAKVNATIGAKTIYDLTDEGVELFFVLGRQGNYESRGFNNLLTQGNEGYQKTSEKILKTDITQVKRIERPSSKGSIKFDTVQWNKDKTLIKGTLEEKIYKTKSWVTAWEEETISKPALVVIGVAAAVGGGLYGANLATTLGAAGKAMTSAGFATLCSTAATSFAATEGDFEKMFKALMSDQTVKSLAVNITTAGVTQGIIDQLGLQIDPKTWTGQLQHNAIQGGVRGVLDMAVLGEKPEKALKTAVIHTAVNTVAGKLASDTGVGKTGKIAIQTTAGGITGALMGGKTEDIVNGAISGLTAALVSDALEKKPEQKAVEKKKEDSLKETLSQEQDISEEIKNRLKEAGATKQEIEKITSDTSLKKLLEEEDTFQKMRRMRIRLVNGKTPAQDILKPALSLMTDAGIAFHEFSEKNPKLTKFALIAFETALSGPTQLIKNQFLDYTGIQGKFDEASDYITTWCSKRLQNHLGVERERADLLAHGGKFGFMLAASTTIGGNKDKIADAAKDVAERARKIPSQTRDYVRHVEGTSKLPLHADQKKLLKEDLRKTEYKKITTEELAEKNKEFRKQKDTLISKWETHTKQEWPTYEKNVYNPKTGKEIAQEGKKHQAHHIVPQQLGGKHEWWNIHPLPIPEHQNIVHGASGPLNKILKDLGKK